MFAHVSGAVGEFRLIFRPHAEVPGTLLCHAQILPSVLCQIKLWSVASRYMLEHALLNRGEASCIGHILSQNLTVTVFEIVWRHIGHKAPAAMIPSAQLWHAHCTRQASDLTTSSLSAQHHDCFTNKGVWDGHLLWNPGKFDSGLSHAHL